MDIQALLKYLSSLYSLTDQFSDRVARVIKTKKYHKGTVLEKPVSSVAMWYIHQGLIKTRFFDDQGKEHITRFWQKGEVILLMGHYSGLDVAGVQNVLLEDCVLSTVSGNKLLFLYYNFDEAPKLAGKIVLRDRNKGDEKSYLCSLTASDAYNEFQKTFPHERILLKDIAAFLEITPGTLSEIRKTLKNK